MKTLIEIENRSAEIITKIRENKAFGERSPELEKELAELDEMGRKIVAARNN